MNIDFNKGQGLVPVIIQDELTLQVLMLGYMNEEAYKKTMDEGKICFFSRSKNRLWTKGETSGNFLFVKNIEVDCDNDTLLIKATPKGPTCHTGTTSCFGNASGQGFLYVLENIIKERIDNKNENSYTYKIFSKGINKMAQKVGEEAVEVVIESKDNNDNLFINEVADLIYHLLILLKGKKIPFITVEQLLMQRNEK